MYPTFARTKHHDSSISKSVVSLLNKFGWKKVTFIYSDQIESVADTVAEVRDISLTTGGGGSTCKAKFTRDIL